jgi:predicted outer membrane repeat protein
MKFLFSVFFFIVLISFLSATIINVPADQPTIQAGINVAVDSDTVLVQPGTYIENINYNGKNITVASLFLTIQDTIYISQTIIDGNQDSSVVTFESEEDSTAILTGFIITNGNSTSQTYQGGGIYCYDSSNPSLDNLIITGNSANYGGGICCNLYSSPSLENVTISDNYADYTGGGICCISYSSPSLVHVTITGNSSADWGGGIECYHYSNPSLVNVTITGNSAANRGGGIRCEESSPNLVNVTITDNSADVSGGGIYCEYSSPSLENVTISGNTSFAGGGLYCCFFSSPDLENVTIANNSASIAGGGIYCYYYNNLSLVNVTITGNSAGDEGGGICCLHNSSLNLINCVMWNDTPQEVYFADELEPNTITISYSDIQGGEAGIVTNNNGTVNWLEGNIDEDPLFIGTGEHPYSLLENSPCIDAGNPDPIYYDPEDPSNPGYALYPAMGTIINDMGAYGGPNTIGWPVVGLDDNVIVYTPEVFLQQNYPNPFNPQTTISFQLSENGEANLSIYNIKGQLVKELVNKVLSSGEHSAIWNGKDENEKKVSSGIYFYKLNVNGKTEAVRKCLLLK